MDDFDPYSQKVADVCALIRQHGKCEEWELLKNSERGLEILCAILDATEAKSAARIAELEREIQNLKLSANLDAEDREFSASLRAAKALVPEGWKLVPEISTSKMDRAGEDAYEHSGHCDCGNANGCSMEIVFRAMLDAAPEVAEQTKEQAR